MFFCFKTLTIALTENDNGSSTLGSLIKKIARIAEIIINAA
ncbi:hypothetical protein [Mycoplasma capricolum]